MLPRVFERHITGSKGGSGIGLALCKEIIESHGGQINIESEPGKGTAVTFSLPVYKGDV
jgi:signal transduction histidine kinase